MTKQKCNYRCDECKWRPRRSSPKMQQFFPPNSGKDQKKGLYQKRNTFFPEFQWRPALRCTPESNYWGDTVKVLGEIFPPPGFGTPGIMWLNSVQYTRIKGGRRFKTCYKTAISTELQQIKNYAKPVAIGQLSCWNTHIRPSLNQFLVFILYIY